ncbi:MAG TPA: hypothetical protein VHB99_11100 [Pirellulales bacterium]|nr:hypothetical protein [Pirellulales bacterium]
MDRANIRPTLLDFGWLAICVLASSVWCVSAASQLSATFDEPLYMVHGLEGWRTGSNAGLIRFGTMPLPIDVETLPVYLWERWRGEPFDPLANLDQILPVARAAALVFWWTLLVYGWLVGRKLAGPWGGRLAVAWLACEPNLLAHASLATTDIGISACLLALGYHFAGGREASWRRRVALPGVLYGVALAAKASALVYGPLILAAIEFERVWLNGQLKACFVTPPDAAPMGRLRRLAALFGRLREFSLPFRRDLLQVMAIGFGVMLVYCGCDWRPEPSFVVWAQKLPEGGFHDVMLWIAEHLRIFSNGAEGIVRQIKHNLKGHQGSYLLGEVHAREVWYYFPVAFSIKLALPLLFAPLAVAAGRRRAALNWACAAALVLFLFSMNCRVQIGIRLMLPLIVMLVVGLSAAIADAAVSARSIVGRRLWGFVATASVAWTLLAACQVWPHGLCYTNELWGGVSQGYLCLSDSNYDWGQGVKELRRWQQEQGVDVLNVWYFGTDPAVAVPPLRFLPLQQLPMSRPEDVLAYAQGDYFAVGATLLYGTTTCQEPHRKAVEFFRRLQPVARTTTFLIFDLRGGDKAIAAGASPERQAMLTRRQP